MTISEVKQNLPNVQIKVNNHIYTGQIRGRLLAFLTVYVDELRVGYEFTWCAITRVLNADRVLIGY